ncbi:MAG: helix-hairpin-helix domain-containing protein [Oscillospiraceae bacterium]|jgi:competence protein ComEA|nr:helix-hairpin-helix domain-containing protein [Oscillospiraceae bacterium]
MKKATIAVFAVTALFLAFTAGFFTARLSGGGKKPVISVAATAQGTPSAAPSAAPSVSKTPEPEPSELAPHSVNINTASSEELQRLPGIGPGLAEKIISYREKHGDFSQPADIMLVSGIGAGIFEAIEDYITV